MTNRPSAFVSGPPDPPGSPKTPATTYEAAAQTPRAVAEALRCLDGVQATGEPDQWNAFCPTEESPSKRHLRVKVGDGQLPRFHCFLDCKWRDIRAGLLARGVPEDCVGRVGGATTTVPGSPRPGQSVARASVGAGPVPMVEEQYVQGWYVRLMCDSARMAYLLNERGLTAEAVTQGMIGWDGTRYTIPIYDEIGRCLNVRRYLPGSPQKMINLKGYGTNRLYAPDGIDAARPVLLCGGEWDALLAWQHGFNSVTFTGGESSVPALKYLEVLRGREVVVAYDCDDAGRKGARKVAAALTAELGCSVAVADLVSGLGKNVRDGDDVTDWFVHHKRTADDLRSVLDAAVPWVDSEQDDVLAAVKAQFLLNPEEAADHLADLLDDSAVAALPPVTYVVDGWIPTDGNYSVLYGEPGIGKTLALLGMTRAVRRGTRWQTNATTKGAVVFYQGEGLAQFKDRIAAWDDRYPLRKKQSMAPVGYSERIVDLTKPEGVAAVIRTVRGFEAKHDTKVRLLVIDPLVEYMTGDENGEGMERSSRGLRALARLLPGVGVVVGHHTNASGERERGAAFLKMRAAAHIRMEPLGDAGIGLFQHKQRNGVKVALTLEMRGQLDSVVLECKQAMLAQDYVADKEGAAKRKTEATNADKRAQAEKLLMAAVGHEPGVGKDRLLRAATSHGVGKRFLELCLSHLVDSGALRTEKGDRNAIRHYLP